MKSISWLVIVVVLLMACEPEEQRITTNPDAMLTFSADTVLFDTVFTAIPTVTRRLYAFNPNSGAVNISRIELGGGSASSFNVTINGQTATSFSDIRLLRGDSMLVLVDALIDPTNANNPFVIGDSILFETNGNMQQVKIDAWGQDAVYLEDSILQCNTTWTNEKPYVIYNSVLVDSLCTLTIEPGTKVYSHKGSTLFIKGTLKANGQPDDRIVFLNDRLDDNFSQAPGQWEGIYFLEGSKDNVMEFADIRNAVFGIWLGTPDDDIVPDLVLNGVKIENMSRTGIVAFTSDLEARNTLVNNCIEYLIGNFAGGNYTYENCTFANYSTFFFRDNPAFVVADNLVLANNEVLTGDVSLTVLNSIIWGDLVEELLLSNDGGADFGVLMGSSILKTQATDLDINGNLLNTDPLFVDPFDYNYHLDSLSPAIDAALDIGLKEDLEGNPRGTSPDIGAYEQKF